MERSGTRPAGRPADGAASGTRGGCAAHPPRSRRHRLAPAGCAAGGAASGTRHGCAAQARRGPAGSSSGPRPAEPPPYVSPAPMTTVRADRPALDDWAALVRGGWPPERRRQGSGPDGAPVR